MGSYRLKGRAMAGIRKAIHRTGWPRQVKFRTESASRGFAHLVEQSGDNFPDAVRTVLSLLRPVAHLDMITYRLSKEPAEGTNDFAQRFPAETLQMLDALIADDRSQMPYELGKGLVEIGRASGRAGGCKHVEFSVCAVSLQKKNEKNDEQ